MATLATHINWLLTPHNSADALTWILPAALQFIFSWIGFVLYMTWDYASYVRGTLETDKLPSRHPIHESPTGEAKHYLLGVEVSPFWYSQLFMVPIVLYNQLVVWPLMSLLFVWPQWAQHQPGFIGSDWSWVGFVCCFAVCMMISDQMWYWCHRLMHVPFCWKYFHKMHHIAPQCAISATYVHPVEYALFTISMQLPWAIAGFPIWIYVIPMSWGMLTGSGAHSGYGGPLANGEKHGTGHHLYHSANFSLTMVADVVWGTHWNPGDPPPRYFALGKNEIEAVYTTVKGTHFAEKAPSAESAATAPVKAVGTAPLPEPSSSRKKQGGRSSKAD